MLLLDSSPLELSESFFSFFFKADSLFASLFFITSALVNAMDHPAQTRHSKERAGGLAKSSLTPVEAERVQFVAERVQFVAEWIPFVAEWIELNSYHS